MRFVLYEMNISICRVNGEVISDVNGVVISKRCLYVKFRASQVVVAYDAGHYKFVQIGLDDEEKVDYFF